MSESSRTIGDRNILCVGPVTLGFYLLMAAWRYGVIACVTALQRGGHEALPEHVPQVA